MALQQLLCRPDAHLWALRHVAYFLDAADATRLVLLATPSGRADLRRLRHWLLHGDAPFPPLDTTHVLFAAARLGDWPSVALLLHQLKCDAPPATTAVKPKGKKPPVAPPLDQEPWRRLSTVFEGAGVQFPVDVLEAAATRGELAAVQWLLPRVKKGVNTVTMGGGRQVEIPEDDLDIINTALIAAGEARQLRVIDWLVTATPRIHCVLPLDEELKAVCWYYTYEDKAFFYNCATAQHGIEFAGASFDVASGDGLSDDKPTHMPFANKFARDGDLDTLAKIYARANHRALIAPHAMEAAAGSGHLDVVKWFHQRFPTYLTSSCLTAAAKGGHMHVLQWIEQFGLPVCRSNVIEAASAGQVAALRWLRVRDESMWRKIHPEAMIQAAKHGRREVLEYYHEECGLPVTPSALKSLSACKSVETVEYVLDRIQATPAELQEMFHYAASDSNLAVVEYLATQRRLWSREAFEAAVYRERSPQAKEEQLKVEAETALAVSQYLIQQARIRAETLGTPLAAQVVLEDICILHLADLKNYAIAEWIARSVPEADCDPSGLLDGDNYPPKDADAKAMTSVVLACLTHRREQCRAVSWLPRWAVAANCAKAFDVLVQMEHPALGSIDVQRAIIDNSRDGRFMMPLLSRMTSGTLSTDIVTWAASYGIRPVLERVYAQESKAKRQRMLQLIATRGAEHGHVDVLDWVRATCETDRLPKVIVFADVASGSARCGRVEVLQWLLERTLLPLSDGDKVNSIVREAARHRRVDSLRWLLANVAVPTRVVAQILVDAAKNDREEIVWFLTTRFAPAELALSKPDAARVRALVKREV